MIIKRLSLARQKLKDIITDRKMIADFVCVVDLDDVLNSNFNKKNIVNLMQNLRNNEKRYFGISASSSPFYYDILNFSNDDLKSVKIIDVQDRKGLNSYFERKKYIYNNQKKFTKDSSFESISSFNGMCLYFYNDFIKSDYVSFNSKEIIPEHLNLNTKIYELTKKKLLVSNELVLNTPVEHMPPNSLIEFLSIRF